MLGRDERVATGEEEGGGDTLSCVCGLDWSKPKPKWLARSIEERFARLRGAARSRERTRKKNRATSLGMTGLGGWLRWLPELGMSPTPHFSKKRLDLIENKGLRHQKTLSKTAKMAVEMIFEAFFPWGACQSRLDFKPTHYGTVCRVLI